MSKGHANSFSASWEAKKRIGRSCLSDILNRRMVFKTHNLSSGSLKNVFGDVNKPMYQGIERPCEIIFCILGIEKSDLDVVPYLIFLVGLWNVLKNDFREVDE
jgi:hypothetical protein